MKWFQHQCDAAESPKIDKLMMKYGLSGYGLYFYILEKIGKPDEFSGYLADSYDIEYLSLKTKIDQDEMLEMIEYMVKINLFDNDEWNKNKRIYCPKLIERADEYTKRLNRNKRKSEQSTDTVQTPSVQSISKTEQNKTEYNKTKKKRAPGSNEPSSSKKSKSKIPKQPKELIEYYHNLCKNKYDINYVVQNKDIGMFTQIWKLSKYDLSLIEKVYESAFYDKYWWNAEDHIVEPSTIVMKWNDIMARLNGKTKEKQVPKKDIVYCHEVDLSKYPSQVGWEDMEEDIRSGKWTPTDYSNGKTS